MYTNNGKSLSFRIGFLCSGNGGLFQRAAEACKMGLLNSRIVVCVTDRTCRSQEVAEKYNIPVRTIPRKDYASRDAFSADVRKALEQHQANLFFLTFDSLLSGPILQDHWGRMINVHLSLLPVFPGFKAVEKTIRAGVRFGGSTLHLVDETVDGGPIITQGIIPLEPRVEREDYESRLFKITWLQMIQTIRWYEEDRVIIKDEKHPYIVKGRYDSTPFCPALELPELLEEAVR